MSDIIRFVCDRCLKLSNIGEQRYVFSAELFAAFDGLEITEDDLSKDLKSEINELVKSMENIDSDLLQNEVHKFYDLSLCKQCRDELFQFLNDK